MPKSEPDADIGQISGDFERGRFEIASSDLDEIRRLTYQHRQFVVDLKRHVVFTLKDYVTSYKKVKNQFEKLISQFKLWHQFPLKKYFR